MQRRLVGALDRSTAVARQPVAAAAVPALAAAAAPSLFPGAGAVAAVAVATAAAAAAAAAAPAAPAVAAEQQHSAAEHVGSLLPPVVRASAPRQEAGVTLGYLLGASKLLVPLESPLYQPQYPGMQCGAADALAFSAGFSTAPSATGKDGHPARPYALMHLLDDDAYSHATTSSDVLYRDEFCPLLPHWSFHASSAGLQQRDTVTCARQAAMLADCRLIDASKQAEVVPLELLKQREMPRHEFTAQFCGSSVASSSSQSQPSVAQQSPPSVLSPPAHLRRTAMLLLTESACAACGCGCAVLPTARAGCLRAALLTAV
jgi:hypothetical protein